MGRHVTDWCTDRLTHGQAATLNVLTQRSGMKHGLEPPLSGRPITRKMILYNSILEQSSSKNSQTHITQHAYSLFLPCLRDGVERRPLSILLQLTDWQNAIRTLAGDVPRRSVISLCSGRQRLAYNRPVVTSPHNHRWALTTTKMLLRSEQSNVDDHSFSLQSTRSYDRKGCTASSTSICSSFGQTFPGTQWLRQRRVDRVFVDDIDGARRRSVALRSFHIPRNRLPSLDGHN